MRRVFALLAALACPTVATAQVGHSLQPSHQAFPYELAEARQLPVGSMGAALESLTVDEARGGVVGRPGHPPIREEHWRVRFVADHLAATDDSRAVVSPNVGTAKGHFSSSRVIPVEAVDTYPFTAIGKLFGISADDRPFHCSAAVIARRIILTAGHCVHQGFGGAAGFVKELRFQPGYHFGTALGEWQATYVVTTNDWITKGSKGPPNAADYAVVELQDNELGRVGDEVGWLGTLTKKLSPNHVAMLGYPASFDAGEWMHVVNAESLKTVTGNAVLYGSDMTAGSSGGPWVQNFGAPSTGQVGGSNSAFNRVVGVMSYGPKKPGESYAGSSILDQRFTQILNTICARRAGNCS